MEVKCFCCSRPTLFFCCKLRRQWWKLLLKPFILTLQTTLTRLQTRQCQTVETNNTSQARLKELRRVSVRSFTTTTFELLEEEYINSLCSCAFTLSTLMKG